ncbi:MAG: hypothetical protein ACJAVM_002880 [Sulfitobacter sp.]|jgi:hypothetical protein
MRTIEKPTISSALLGLNAYQQATGQRRDPGRVPHPAQAKPASNSYRSVRSKQSTKEIKISVLKSLQAQSNSGLVKMRDVSSALDALLRNG